MKNINKYIIYFVAINLLILGIDKFFQFIPESCTLLEDASKTMMYSLGVIEIVLAFFLFVGKFTKKILLAIVLLMAWATLMHFMNDTYDIGGAVFLGIIALLPLFIKSDVGSAQ